MSNRYRAVHPSYVAIYGDEPFDHEFGSADEEADALKSGFEQVPRPYRVLSDNYTIDGKPVERGSVFEAAFPLEIEAMWVDGGHLERVRSNTKPTVEVDALTGELADPADLHPTEQKPPTKKAPAKRATARTKE